MELFFYFDPPVIGRSSFSHLVLKIKGNGWAEAHIVVEPPLSLKPGDTEKEKVFKLGMVAGEKTKQIRIFALPVGIPGIYRVNVDVFMYDMEGVPKEHKKGSLLLTLEK